MKKHVIRIVVGLIVTGCYVSASYDAHSSFIVRSNVQNMPNGQSMRFIPLQITNQRLERGIAVTPFVHISADRFQQLLQVEKSMQQLEQRNQQLEHQYAMLLAYNAQLVKHREQADERVKNSQRFIQQQKVNHDQCIAAFNRSAETFMRDKKQLQEELNLSEQKVQELTALLQTFKQ